MGGRKCPLLLLGSWGSVFPDVAPDVGSPSPEEGQGGSSFLPPPPPLPPLFSSLIPSVSEYKFSGTFGRKWRGFLTSKDCGVYFLKSVAFSYITTMQMCQNQEIHTNKTLLSNPQTLFRCHPLSYLSSVIRIIFQVQDAIPDHLLHFSCLISLAFLYLDQF